MQFSKTYILEIATKLIDIANNCADMETSNEINELVDDIVADATKTK